MNVAVWMPIWGRHDVLKIALIGYRAMKKRWAKEGHELHIYFGWTDPADLMAATSFMGYPNGACPSPNEPLTEKHNRLLRYILNETEADYFLQIGSDDVFLPEGDKLYFEAMEAGAHHIGCKSIYFMDSAKERAVKWKYDSRDANALFGAGRLFSREAVEMAFLDGELWDREANRSLDFISENRLIGLGYQPKAFGEDEPYIIDIKSAENIWGFDRYANGEGVDYDELVGRMRETIA